MITVLCGHPVVAVAQERLTLDAAVESALSRNAALRSAQATAAAAAARVGQSRSGFFPRISFTEAWQRGNQPVFVFSSLLTARRFAADNFALDALNHPDPLGFFRSTVAIEQVLLDGGRQRTTARMARLGADEAAAAAAGAAADIVMATTETFGRVLAAEADRRVAESGIAAAREDLARAERRRDAGAATEADVLSLVVHVADLERRAIQAQGEAAVARAALNQLIGASIATDYAVVEPPPPTNDVGNSLPTLLAEAEASRPELHGATAAEQRAMAASRLARAGLFPHVGAQGVFDLGGTRFSDRASAWLVGLELRWTLSTGGAERAAIKAAAHEATRARAELDAVRAAVHVDVVSAVRRLETARARGVVGRAAVEQARERQRIIRDRFDAGLAAVNDVLQASTALVEAESHRVGALVDAIVSESALRRALGRTSTPARLP